MAVLGWPKTIAWTDFGTPVSSVPASYSGTHTDCHIEVDINYSWGGPVAVSGSSDYKLKDVKVEVKINSIDTWVMTGVPTSKTQATILKHEQGHYNIAGITARDVEKMLTNLRNADANDLANDATTKADSIISDGLAKEDKYDDVAANGGTDNGNDVNQQNTWNSKIAAAKSLADLP